MSWHLEIEDSVALLRFAHPPRNLATYADMEHLEALLTEADSRGARVVIVTGAVPGFFIGHADLEDLIALKSGAATSGDGSAWGRTLRMLDRGPMVSLAAINGQAWGGGAELALTCNLRWMADEATLALPEVALGVIPGVGAHRAIRLLPEHLAFEMLVGCRPIPAAEASTWHLVNRVVPLDRLLEDAVNFARLIVSRPPQAVAAVRELVVGHRDDTVRNIQRRQIELFMETLHTERAGRLIEDAQRRYEAGGASAEALAIDPSVPD